MLFKFQLISTESKIQSLSYTRHVPGAQQLRVALLVHSTDLAGHHRWRKAPVQWHAEECQSHSSHLLQCPCSNAKWKTEPTMLPVNFLCFLRLKIRFSWCFRIDCPPPQDLKTWKKKGWPLGGCKENKPTKTATTTTKENKKKTHHCPQNT